MTWKLSEFTEYVEPVWRNLNMRKLKVDEAYVILKSFYNENIYLYFLSEECFSCPFIKISEFHNMDNLDLMILKMNTATSLKFKISDRDYGKFLFENQTGLCSINPHDAMKEFGVYNLTISSNGTCYWHMDKDGVRPIYSLWAVLFLCVFLFLAARIIHKYFKIPAMNSQSCHTETREVLTDRLKSLDVFRGLSIVLMIFVNSGGGGFWWVEHVPWNGLHLADIVFPCFIWICGVCIPLSIKSQLRNNVSKKSICKGILLRSVKLFLIGLCLNSLNGPIIEDLRIMGVLQRFGIAIVLCGTIHVIFTKSEYIMPQELWKQRLYDFILLKKEILFVLLLVTFHTIIIFSIQIPGCPRGYLGPGGNHHQGLYPNCTGGATGFIDTKILGENHIYQHPSAKKIFNSHAFDPEGIIGGILTTVQAFFGLHAGCIILVYQCKWKRLSRWLLSAFILTAIGGILCSFQKESGIIPINKNLWSLTFVLVTSGLAYFIQSLIYFCVDVRKCISGTPLIECGRNAIILYIGHTIMHKLLPWHWRVGEMNTHFVLLLESIWNTFLWVQIAVYLDKKKIYFKL